MGGMAARRTAEEIRNLVDGYQQRTITRAEYCLQQGITHSALGYYLRRYGKKVTRFARVKLASPSSEAAGRFSLLLCNGRRIESAWNFRDGDLARLIRIAEGE